MNEQREPIRTTSMRCSRSGCRAAVGVLALALAATACSSGGGDSGRSDAEGDFTTTPAPSDAADAERSFGGETTTSALTEADETQGDAEAQGQTATEDFAATQGDAGAGRAGIDGGFFEDDSVDADRERGLDEGNTFADAGIRSFIAADRDPLSTFALDVDSASYTVGRQWLDEGRMPVPDSVRVEEYVNAFDFDYPAPVNGLTVVADAGPSPFDDDTIMLRLGVAAEEVANGERPDASLTFVVDTSGSMDRTDRLDLVKRSLRRLVTELDRNDTVALVTYSDGADVVLEPTSADDTDAILDAIDRLRPSGSTNLEAGLLQGYELANQSFRRGGINRVILASDGVANVGLTDPDGLVSLIRDDADEGIQLVTIGVGMGNFNDVVMETLADDGDGFYAYVNDDDEADRLFGDELVSTLLTVAIDAKIQVEFDPEVVSEYRLVGYENRAVLDQDFRNDRVDAGELGAGHQVTALYELRLVDSSARLGGRDRVATVALRWQDPDDRDVVETRLEVSGSTFESRWSDTDDDYRLAVTVAAFAELLRQSPYADRVDLDQVANEANDLAGRRSDLRDFVDMVEAARVR